MAPISIESNSLFVNVVPGFVPQIRVGDVVDLTDIQEGGIVTTSSELNKDKFEVIENDDKAASVEETYSESNKEKAQTISGNLSVSFNMAGVAKVSGSASVDFDSKTSQLRKTRTFRSYAKTRTERLYLHDIKKEDFGVELSNYDHIVTEVTYGKSAVGFFELTSEKDKTDMQAKGELDVSIAKVPIGGKGNIDYKWSELETSYKIRASLARTGDDNVSPIGSAKAFGDAIGAWADSEDEGVIGYKLTPLKAYPGISKEIPDRVVDEFKRALVVERMYELVSFSVILNYAHADPYQWVPDGEKREYGRVQIRCHDEVQDALTSLNQAVRAKQGILKKINKVLDETKFMTVDKYKFADEGTCFYEFSNLVEKHLKKMNPFFHYVGFNGKKPVAGYYKKSDELARGRPIWIRQEPDSKYFAFYETVRKRWTITTVDYKNTIVSETDPDKLFGGWAFSIVTGSELGFTDIPFDGWKPVDN